MVQTWLAMHQPPITKEDRDIRDIIQENAKRLREIYPRFPFAGAYEAFFAQYDALAFPGGLCASLDGIRQGDVKIIESALAFLEVKPYFHRSQYIRTRIIRLLKQATLSSLHAARFERVKELEHKKKMQRKGYD